jgi:hypothetical protein
MESVNLKVFNVYYDVEYTIEEVYCADPLETGEDLYPENKNIIHSIDGTLVSDIDEETLQTVQIVLDRYVQEN